MYALKLSLRPWKNGALGQWCGVVTLGLILTACGIALTMAQGLNSLHARIRGENVATIYFASQQEESRKKELTDEIQLRLGSSAQSITRVTADEFLKNVEASNPELAAEVASLGADLKLIAPEYVSVQGHITPAQIEELKALQGIEAVDVSAERMKPLLNQVTAFRGVMVGLSGLLLGCFFVVMNLLAQVNRTLHRESEGLVAQLGGSRLQVRLPALADLALTGFLAGSIAVFFWAVSDAFVLRQMALWSPLLKDLPRQSAAHLALLPMVGLLLGAVWGGGRSLKVRA